MSSFDNLCIDCECRFGGDCGNCEYRTHKLLPEMEDIDEYQWLETIIDKAMDEEYGIGSYSQIM